MSGPMHVSRLDESDPILRDRLAEDGYLFVPGLLPPDALADLLDRFAAHARDARWIDAGDDGHMPRALPGSACIDGDPAYLAVYARMFREESFHRLLHARATIGLMRRLFDGPVLPHPRGIVRAMFPGSGTAPHQDYYYTQGTPSTYTAWIPLADCSRSMGALEVARGSHRAGLRPTGDDLGPGGADADDGLAAAWRSADFERGDVVIFHSMLVHRAPNNASDRLRLSIDFRYQPRALPISRECLVLARDGQTWDDVYAGWQSTECRYYWRRWQLVLAAIDPSLMAERESRALERGAAKDPRAAVVLRRIARFDRDRSRRDLAEGLLAALVARGEP